MFLRKLRVHKDGKEHGYWSLVETMRTADGPRQRTLCYLGELNGSAHARWQKTVEAFNEHGESTQLKLFPSDNTYTGVCMWVRVTDFIPWIPMELSDIYSAISTGSTRCRPGRYTPHVESEHKVEAEPCVSLFPAL